MTETFIRAPRFEFGTAVTQIFNLPGGKGYLFRVMGFATLLLVAALVLLGVPIIKAYVALFEGLATLDTAGMTEAEEMAASYAAMGPMIASMGWFSLLYIVQIGLYVSVETALYRNIINGEDKGLFPLRFGMDEFKVLVTRIVVAIIIYAAIIIGYIGMFIFGAIIIGLGSIADSTAILVILGFIIGLIVLVLIAGLIYMSIRLAPSAAFSVRDEDFTPVGSWATMKTYVWPTFGAVLVVGIIGYISLVVFSFLALGILIYISGIIPMLMTLEDGASETPDFSPILDTLTSAGFIVPAILVIAISAFFSFMYFGAIWSIWGHVAKLTDRRNVEAPLP